MRRGKEELEKQEKYEISHSFKLPIFYPSGSIFHYLAVYYLGVGAKS